MSTLTAIVAAILAAILALALMGACQAQEEGSEASRGELLATSLRQLLEEAKRNKQDASAMDTRGWPWRPHWNYYYGSRIIPRDYGSEAEEDAYGDQDNWTDDGGLPQDEDLEPASRTETEDTLVRRGRPGKFRGKGKGKGKGNMAGAHNSWLFPKSYGSDRIDDGGLPLDEALGRDARTENEDEVDLERRRQKFRNRPNGEGADRPKFHHSMVGPKVVREMGSEGAEDVERHLTDRDMESELSLETRQNDVDLERRRQKFRNRPNGEGADSGIFHNSMLGPKVVREMGSEGTQDVERQLADRDMESELSLETRKQRRRCRRRPCRKPGVPGVHESIVFPRQAPRNGKGKKKPGWHTGVLFPKELEDDYRRGDDDDSLAEAAEWQDGEELAERNVISTDKSRREAALAMVEAYARQLAADVQQTKDTYSRDEDRSFLPGDDPYPWRWGEGDFDPRSVSSPESDAPETRAVGGPGLRALCRRAWQRKRSVKGYRRTPLRCRRFHDDKIGIRELSGLDED